MTPRTATPVLLALTLSLAGAPALLAANADAAIPDHPTFYRDALPILQANCQTCHRPAGENIGGMLAPMSLLTYDDVRPWAKSIARNIQSRAMPPWFASADTRGVFQHERILSDREIETVVRWASNGAPAGDPADAPPPRHFADVDAGGWTNGRPDLIVPLPPYFVEDDVEDLNINFLAKLTPEQLPEDAWVRGVEFKVGGHFVHHMCIFLLLPGEGEIGDVTEALNRNSLGCIALGAEPTLLPEGYAYRLKAGTTLVFSMHYHKEPGPGTGVWDRSELGFIFHREPVAHRVRYDAVGHLNFEVPPRADRWQVGASKVYDEDTTLLALWPHAHLRAVETRYTAHYPDGTSELLLHVPRYDQEWQTTYLYNEPKRIPAGTRLEVSFWYDNTPARAAERGFDSTDAVAFGPETTDEMMLGFLNYTHTAPIDFAEHPERIDSAALDAP